MCAPARERAKFDAMHINQTPYFDQRQRHVCLELKYFSEVG